MGNPSKKKKDIKIDYDANDKMYWYDNSGFWWNEWSYVSMWEYLKNSPQSIGKKVWTLLDSPATFISWPSTKMIWFLSKTPALLSKVPKLLSKVHIPRFKLFSRWSTKIWKVKIHFPSSRKTYKVTKKIKKSVKVGKSTHTIKIRKIPEIHWSPENKFIKVVTKKNQT